MTAPTHKKAVGVSSIELFFDPVSVFVITQVTQLVERAHANPEKLEVRILRRPRSWE